MAQAPTTTTTYAIGQEGGLSRDNNNIAIQVGEQFVTADVTASPQTSPLSFNASGGAAIAIAVPSNAIELIMRPSVDMRISELSSMAQYDIINAFTKEAIGVADMATVYIKADGAAGGTVNFRFTILV